MHKHKPKILIIDDDSIINSVMSEILKDEEYDLYFAINGQDGVEKANAIHPDLIFLDMCMPVLDGLGFLKEWKQRGSSSCPVLVITGYEDDQVLNECFDQGICSLIRKPFRSSEIIALCRRYTRLTEIKKRLSFNVDTLTFLSKQASSFGLDNMDEQDLIEALPFPVFVKNRERVVIQVNKALEDFTGLARDSIVGKTCEESHINKQCIIARNQEVELTLVSEGGVACHEQMVTDRQGQQREVLIYLSAVTNGTHKRPVGILGVMVDITEFGFSSFKKLLATRYPNLSAREREVANLVRLGMSNKEVAHQLNIALCTVEYHRAHLREKLGLKKGDNVNLSTALLSL
ncbi:MAG: response regulator [Desulfocapsaceae bacterium]|nr:response regulator [Desulfocapsaceae bacterium]